MESRPLFWANPHLMHTAIDPVPIGLRCEITGRTAVRLDELVNVVGPFMEGRVRMDAAIGMSLTAIMTPCPI